jgi:hypothetical protein
LHSVRDARAIGGAQCLIVHVRDFARLRDEFILSSALVASWDGPQI